MYTLARFRTPWFPVGILMSAKTFEILNLKKLDVFEVTKICVILKIADVSRFYVLFSREVNKLSLLISSLFRLRSTRYYMGINTTKCWLHFIFVFTNTIILVQCQIGRNFKFKLSYVLDTLQYNAMPLKFRETFSYMHKDLLKFTTIWWMRML